MKDQVKRQAIALVAHDNKKSDLLAWCREKKSLLRNFELYATGTTGKLISEELGLPVHRFLSGPLGGDLQLGGYIAEGKIDFLVFFWDPLMAQPHDPDVKALLRIAVVWNIPVACNRASADLIFSSEAHSLSYQGNRPDYSSHNERKTP